MASDPKLDLQKKTILDIVNSKTLEEACLGLFENLKKHYGFSDSFVERVTRNFSTGLEKLTFLEGDGKYFYVMCKKLHQNGLRLAKWMLGVNKKYEGIDASTQKVLYREILLPPYTEKPFDIVKTNEFGPTTNEIGLSSLKKIDHEILIKELTNSISKVTISNPSQIPKTIRLLNAVSLGKEKLIKKLNPSDAAILEIESDVRRNPTREIFKRRHNEYIEMSIVREGLFDIFDSLSKGKDLSEIESLPRFLDVINYHEDTRHILKVLEDGTIDFISSLREKIDEKFFLPKNGPRYISCLDVSGLGWTTAPKVEIDDFFWAQPFVLVISEFLLTILRDRRANFSVKTCKHCNKYYIPKKNYKGQKYCPICSPKSKMSREQRNDYQKEYRARKKEENQAKKREKRIAYFISELNCTREKAIELIEFDDQI